MRNLVPSCNSVVIVIRHDNVTPFCYIFPRTSQELLSEHHWIVCPHLYAQAIDLRRRHSHLNDLAGIRMVIDGWRCVDHFFHLPSGHFSAVNLVLASKIQPHSMHVPSFRFGQELQTVCLAFTTAATAKNGSLVPKDFRISMALLMPTSFLILQSVPVAPGQLGSSEPEADRC